MKTNLIIVLATLVVLFHTTDTVFNCQAQTSDPVLYFSDIISGPKSGNSDASSGRTPDVDGAIVTLWGVNLGSTQGSSKVTCNGADAASYYSWGNAMQPANLYAYHKMQMISFQVSHLAQDGSGEITVTVNGRKSNALPFTVRRGNIFFVKTTGDDGSGNGSWNTPWKTIPQAVASLSSGDIAYICDGVNQTIVTQFEAAVDLSSNGTAANPKALIVYPGATSNAGNPNIGRVFHPWNTDVGGYSEYWVLSKFTITTAGVGVFANTGFRVVGNRFTGPNTIPDWEGTLFAFGNDVVLFGNELYNIGTLQNTEKGHVIIYFSGARQSSGTRFPTERNREAAWNYIHDNFYHDAFHIYSEDAASAYIQQHRIHDNVIVNQRGDGILLGYYVTGENWIYNNLLIRAGLGPEFSNPTYHTGIHLDTGHENVSPGSTVIHCYNNTLYGCGFSGAVYTDENGALIVTPEAINRSTLNIWNNIIVSTGDPYVAGESGTPASGSYHNCWYGYGAAPAWDTGALNSDPLFINAGGNNFQLTKNSPCINAGLDVTPVVVQDLLGVRREKAGCDLGVYEFSPTTAVEEYPYTNFRASMELDQSYPNPLSSSGQEAMITFTLPSHAHVKLSVVDNLGNEIAVLVDEVKEPGKYQTQFNLATASLRPSSLPSGTYYYVLQSSSSAKVKKVMVVR